MNKLTKQLLSLGLSVVTVAGMVSPVLADDEVNTSEPETTEVANQPTENGLSNELATKPITLQITKDGQTTSTTFDVDVNATDDYVTSYIVANCVPEGYMIDGKGAASSLCKVSDTEWQMVLVKKEEQKPDVNSKKYTINVVFEEEPNKNFTTTFDPTNENVTDYILRVVIPEGYTCRDESKIVKDEATNTYTATVVKAKEVYVTRYIDGAEDHWVPILKLPYDYTDKQVKTLLEERYAMGRIISIDKIDDTHWTMTSTNAKEEIEDFTLYINKDGVETSKKIHVSMQDQKNVGGMIQYLKLNYIPDGYHVDYKKGKTFNNGICSLGTDAYRIYLVKNNDKPVLKKYTVKILKPYAQSNYDDYFENAGVEYHTFEYDSKDTTGIEDYIIKKFTPKGCIIEQTLDTNSQFVYKIDEYTYGAIAFDLNGKYVNQTYTSYKCHFIDIDTNKEVYWINQNVVGAKLDRIDASLISVVPTGYVFADESFAVSDKREEEGYSVNVYVKKGEQKTLATINFYKNDGGKLIKIKTVNAYAQDLDLNKDGTVMMDEIKSVMPSGYKMSDLLIPQAPDCILIHGGDVTYTNNITGIYLEELSTVTAPSSSKDAASISGVNSNEVLANSLTKEQKKKYDAAVKEGKKIEFKPVVKNEVNASDKKLLLAYADKADAEVVNAFDIEIELVIDDKNEGLISETDDKLTFKVAIPENLKKDGRKFYVLRAHDGKVEKLPVNEDGTFETDKFSSYMLVYEDVKATTPETKPEVKPGTNTETNPAVKPETKPAAKPSTGTTTTTTDTKKNNTVKKDVKKNKKVNTSTKTSSTLFTGLLGVSIVGLGAVEVLRRRNK